MGAPPISLLGDELLDALAAAATDADRRADAPAADAPAGPATESPAAGSANGAAGG